MDKHRSTLRFDAKREAILSTAANVFNQRGIRGGTLSEVGAGVGLATNSITYYYRKREELAVACLLRSLDALSDVIDQAARFETVTQRIEALFAAHFSLLAAIKTGEHPAVMTFNDLRALAPPHCDSVFEAYNEQVKRMRKLLRGPETQHLSRADIAARSYMVLSLLSWARRCAEPHDTGDYSHLARRLSCMLLHGIALPSSPWPVTLDEASFWAAFESCPELSDPFLRAGSFQVNEHGYRGASIDRISAQLNLTKGAFYGRRDTKDEFIAACFDRKFLVSRLAWEATRTLPQNGWLKLCTALRHLCWFQLSPLGPILRATAIAALPDEAQQSAIRESMRRDAQRIANIVVDGMLDGSVRPCDPALAALMLGCIADTAPGLLRWEPSATETSIANLYLKPGLFGILCH